MGEVTRAVAAAIAGGIAAGSVVVMVPDNGGALQRVEERLREVEQAVLVLTCRLVPDECRR